VAVAAGTEEEMAVGAEMEAGAAAAPVLYRHPAEAWVILTGFIANRRSCSAN